MSKYIQITLLVEPEQMQAIKKLAAEQERSVNGQIRHAIRDYLDRVELVREIESMKDLAADIQEGG